MKDANEVLDQIAKFDISLVELISRVCAKFGIRVKDLVSKSRKRQLSQARGVVCCLAVDELPAPCSAKLLHWGDTVGVMWHAG